MIDIDPNRKFSNGSDWDNSIDCDDASDGSDGGYNRHGSPINPDAMKELIRLRIENFTLHAEIDKLCERKRFVSESITNYVDTIVTCQVEVEKLRAARDEQFDAHLKRVEELREEWSQEHSALSAENATLRAANEELQAELDKAKGIIAWHQ